MKLNELETDENPRKSKRSNLAPVQVIQENSKNSEKSSISLNSSRANSSKCEKYAGFHEITWDQDTPADQIF